MEELELDLEPELDKSTQSSRLFSSSGSASEVFYWDFFYILKCLLLIL